MGSNDDVQIRNPIQESVAFLLGNAPSHSDDRALLVLQFLESSQSTVDFVLGFFPDATSVDEDEIGLFGLFRL